MSQSIRSYNLLLYEISKVYLKFTIKNDIGTLYFVFGAWSRMVGTSLGKVANFKEFKKVL